MKKQFAKLFFFYFYYCYVLEKINSEAVLLKIVLLFEKKFFIDFGHVVRPTMSCGATKPDNYKYMQKHDYFMMKMYLIWSLVIMIL